MDRDRAAGNMGTGMIAAAIALAVFGLTFFVAVVYIG